MKTAIKYFLIYLGLTFVGAIILAFPAVMIEAALHPGNFASGEFSMSTWTECLLMLGSQLLPLFVFWKKKWCDYSFIKNPDTKNFLLWAAVGWVGCVLVATFIQTYMPHFQWDFDILEDIGRLSKNPLGIISVCVLAPLIEEGVFRGTIERKLLEQNRNPWYAICISAIIFAIAHFNLTQGIIALTLGLFIGWIYYRTRNIWYCIFVHALNNTVSTVLFLITGDEGADSPFSLPVNLLLLLVGIGLIYYFAQEYKKLPMTVPPLPVDMPKGPPALPLEETGYATPFEEIKVDEAVEDVVNDMPVIDNEETKPSED